MLGIYRLHCKPSQVSFCLKVPISKWPKRQWVSGDQLKTILSQINDKLSFDKIQVDTTPKMNPIVLEVSALNVSASVCAQPENVLS